MGNGSTRENRYRHQLARTNLLLLVQYLQRLRLAPAGVQGGEHAHDVVVHLHDDHILFHLCSVEDALQVFGEEVCVFVGEELIIEISQQVLQCHVIGDRKCVEPLDFLVDFDPRPVQARGPIKISLLLVDHFQ